VTYDDEHRLFLKANAQGRSYEALAALFNQEFGTDVGRLTISKLCRRFGFTNGSTSRRPYSDEQIEFLRLNAPGVDYFTLAAMFNKQFGTNINADRIGEICRRKGFSNGMDNRYKPGHTVNMGRKLPHALPDGSESINAAGYVMLKHNGDWQFKHIILWEQAHGKSVPEGHYIVFGDSDKRNFAIENLFCITAAQSAIRSKMGLQGATPDLAAAGVALAKLYSQIGERKKEQKKRHQQLWQRDNDP
jgi:transposase